MKISKLKSILFSLMAIAMVTVFLSSCEKENHNQDESSTLINLEDAPFKKEIVTKSDDGTFIFEISSNNEKIMKAVNESSVSFTFLDEYELNKLSEKEPAGEEVDKQIKPQDATKEELLEERPYIGISLTKMMTSDEDIDEIPPYKLQLGEIILNVLRELKAVTVFDFQANVEINDVIDSRVTLWNNNKRVAIHGDCGTAWTWTRNYYAFYGSSSAISLGSSSFKCDARITPCCVGSTSSSGSGSTWIRRVTVTQDVAPSIYGYDNSCWGQDHCMNATWSGCNGYYPNGCHL